MFCLDFLIVFLGHLKVPLSFPLVFLWFPIVFLWFSKVSVCCPIPGLTECDAEDLSASKTVSMVSHDFIRFLIVFFWLS